MTEHTSEATNSKFENRDYHLVIDQSGSMDEPDVGGMSRWNAMKEQTRSLIRKLSKYDPDGITLTFFNGKFETFENVTEEKAVSLFAERAPGGSTVLAPVIESIAKSYLARKAANTTKPNGEITIVATDGQPQDESNVAKAIVNFGNKLDNGDSEYGFSFIQVGKDAQAAAFLRRLDDDLKKQGAKHDIVDAITMDELNDRTLDSVLEGALTD